MNTAAEELNQARVLLSKEMIQERWDFSKLAIFLERLASMFPRTTEGRHRSMIAEFHSCAGRLPVVKDFNFGALALETTADLLEKINYAAGSIMKLAFELLRVSKRQVESARAWPE